MVLLSEHFVLQVVTDVQQPNKSYAFSI